MKQFYFLGSKPVSSLNSLWAALAGFPCSQLYLQAIAKDIFYILTDTPLLKAISLFINGPNGNARQASRLAQKFLLGH